MLFSKTDFLLRGWKRCWTNLVCGPSAGLGVKGLGCIWPWVGVELQRLGIFLFIFLLLMWSLGKEKQRRHEARKHDRIDIDQEFEIYGNVEEAALQK